MSGRPAAASFRWLSGAAAELGHGPAGPSGRHRRRPSRVASPERSRSIEPAKRWPNAWDRGSGALEQGLDVRRRLVEPRVVLRLWPGPCRRPRCAGASPCGHRTSAATPGATSGRGRSLPGSGRAGGGAAGDRHRRDRSEGRAAALGQGRLEDGLEVDLDRVDQAVDGLLARRAAAWPSAPSGPSGSARAATAAARPAPGGSSSGLPSPLTCSRSRATWLGQPSQSASRPDLQGRRAGAGRSGRPRSGSAPGVDRPGLGQGRGTCRTSPARSASRARIQSRRTAGAFAFSSTSRCRLISGTLGDRSSRASAART